MERTFEMTGFNIVTVAGASAYACMLESEGTVAMLWDISNQRRADILMQINDFDMTKYLCEKFDCTADSELFTEKMCELHDELVDARFALEWACAQSLNDVACSETGRGFKNLDCIQHSGEWITNIAYPLPEKIEFDNLDALANFAMAAFNMEHDIGEFTVRVDARITDGTDGQESQLFEYRITGAADHNVLSEIVACLTDWGYTVTFTRIK